MKNKIFLYKTKIKNISMWSFLKWVGIAVIVLYIASATGMKLAQDIKGVKINYSASIIINSDGLLKPVVAVNK
jgi:hypothetical protein